MLSLWYLSRSFDTSLAKDGYSWGWIDQLVQETLRKTEIKERQWERQMNKTVENCKLNVNALQNRKLALTFGKSWWFSSDLLFSKLFHLGRQFISVIRSVCFTQLGNQLSAYATLFYFKRKYGFNAFIAPYQAKKIGVVMEPDLMEIKPLHFVTPSCQNPRCSDGCQVPAWQSVSRHHHGENYQDLMENTEKYMHNKLLDLGNHTVPLYLFKGMNQSFIVFWLFILFLFFIGLRCLIISRFYKQYKINWFKCPQKYYLNWRGSLNFEIISFWKLRRSSVPWGTWHWRTYLLEFMPDVEITSCHGGKSFQILKLENLKENTSTMPWTCSGTSKTRTI